MPDPLPVMILGRLAVERGWQGRNVGKSLLKDAILRTLRAAEIGASAQSLFTQFPRKPSASMRATVSVHRPSIR